MNEEWREYIGCGRFSTQGSGTEIERAHTHTLAHTHLSISTLCTRRLKPSYRSLIEVPHIYDDRVFFFHAIVKLLRCQVRTT